MEGFSSQLPFLLLMMIRIIMGGGEEEEDDDMIWLGPADSLAVSNKAPQWLP